MRIDRPRPAFGDARGEITDLLVGTPIEHATLITSRAGSVRGNHWHDATTQYLYVVRGRMLLTTQQPGGPREQAIVEAGDLFVNAAGERHAMRALEDTALIVLTHGPRGGDAFESDTHRLGPGELLDPP